MQNIAAENVDEYIKAFPPAVRKTLNQLRKTIKSAAPKAEEMISYMMPAYKYYGVLVYFAAYKNHIGFYPGAGGIEAFKKELSAFEMSRGTVRFPIDKTPPFNLITKMVKYRVKQNEEKFALKNISKTFVKKKSSK